MFASNVRINVARVFAFQAAIWTLKFRFAIARRTQVRIQGALVLIALRTFRAYIVSRFQSVHGAPFFDREGRIHEAAPRQVTFQMTHRRIWTIAETATILADILAVERRC